MIWKNEKEYLYKGVWKQEKNTIGDKSIEIDEDKGQKHSNGGKWKRSIKKWGKMKKVTQIVEWYCMKKK